MNSLAVSSALKIGRSGAGRTFGVVLALMLVAVASTGADAQGRPAGLPPEAHPVPDRPSVTGEPGKPFEDAPALGRPVDDDADGGLELTVDTVDGVIARGAPVDVQVRGAKPFSPVVIELRSEPTYLGAGETDENGELDASFGVPSDFEEGEHDLVASGTTSDGDDSTVAVPVIVTTDTTPPKLVDVRAEPLSIDLNEGPAVVTVSIDATDDLAGVASGSVAFGCMSEVEGQPKGQNFRVSWGGLLLGQDNAELVDGTVRDGTWQGLFTVPEAYAGCDLDVVEVALVDRVANWASWSAFDEARPLPVEATPTIAVTPSDVVSGDTAPPILTSVTAAPESLSLEEGDGLVTVDIAAADDLAGVASGSATFVCENQKQPSFSVRWNDVNPSPSDAKLVAGDVTDGVWRGSFVVPVGSPGCTLQLIQVSLSDRVGNVQGWSAFGGDGVELLPEPSPSVEIISDEVDTTAPEVTNISVSPTEVFLGDGDASVTVEIAARDDLSGIGAGDFRFACSDKSPPFFDIRWGTLAEDTAVLASGDRTDGTWLGTFIVPVGHPECEIKLLSAFLVDRAGNAAFWPQFDPEGPAFADEQVLLDAPTVLVSQSSE